MPANIPPAGLMGSPSPNADPRARLNIFAQRQRQMQQQRQAQGLPPPQSRRPGMRPVAPITQPLPAGKPPQATTPVNQQGMPATPPGMPAPPSTLGGRIPGVTMPDSSAAPMRAPGMNAPPAVRPMAPAAQATAAAARPMPRPGLQGMMMMDAPPPEPKTHRPLETM